MSYARRDPQSDNSGAEAGGASLARRPASRDAGTEGPSAVEMTCLPVSGRVGNVKNNDPSLIEPVGSAA